MAHVSPCIVEIRLRVSPSQVIDPPAEMKRGGNGKNGQVVQYSRHYNGILSGRAMGNGLVPGDR